MNELKKHLFWVILGVVVLLSAGAWFYFTPSVTEAESELDSKSRPLKSQKPSDIKTKAHEKAAEDYKKKQDAEKTAVIDGIKAWPQLADLKTLRKRYPDAPPSATDKLGFDKWLGDQRTRIGKKLTDGGVQPPNLDKLLPGGTDDASVELIRHGDYKLRLLALIDDVADAVIPRAGNVSILQFETDPVKDEPIATAPAGALSVLDFKFRTADETRAAQTKAYAEALTKGGRPPKPGGPSATDPTFKGPEMPVAVSSMDIEFTGHVGAIPTLLRRFEATDHYHGSVAKVDFERIPPLFPGPITDTRVQQDYAKAEYKPTLNTHYGEPAVKVAVTVELYEFDQKKFDAMDAKPAPATGPGNKPKPPPPKAPN